METTTQAAGAKVEREPPPSIDYRAFLESTPLVPWELDTRSMRLSYVGPQVVDLLGYPIESWLRPSFWMDHVLPDDQAQLEAARRALLVKGGSHVIEYRMEHREGHLVWVSETASAVSGKGRTCSLRGFLSDVTERRRLEAAMAHNEDRLRGLLRGAPDAMFLTDAEGKIRDMNDQAKYLVGYTLEEIRGSSVDLLVPERLRPRLALHRDAFERDPARRTLVDGQTFALQRSDAEEVYVELSMSRIPNLGGSQFLYSVRDLTVRQRVQAQLAASEKRIRGMADALPALVCFVDAKQRYRFANETYAEWARWDRKEMEGRPVRDVLGATLYEEARPFIEAALAGESVHYLADVTGPNGVVSRVDVSYVPHREEGVVNGYFVVVVAAGAEASDAEDVKDFRDESMPGAAEENDENDRSGPAAAAS